MAEPQFAGDDDLPRTFRREREARDREARERDASRAGHGMAAPVHAHGGNDYGPPPQDYGPAPPDSLYGSGSTGTVTRFEVPFFHLVTFFLKAVVAAIPALILLGVLLFGMGKVLQNFFPTFRLFEIQVRSLDAAAPAAQVAPLPKAPPAAKK